MTKSAKHNISILMALLLIFSPLNSVYADQQHDCKQSETIATQAHEHKGDTPIHHDEASKKSDQGSDCVSCIGQSCCCDSASCSCVMVLSVYAQFLDGFDFSYNFPDPGIPFTLAHHIQPDAPLLLRPPIV